LEMIGPPIVTCHRWPSPVKTNAVFLPQEDSKAPQPAFRVRGCLLRLNEQSDRERGIQVDTYFGNGKGRTDGQLNRKNRSTVNTCSITLTLERPDGTAVSHATACYTIEVEKSERQTGFSVFVAGNGIGFAGRIGIAQDMGEALLTAVGCAAIRMLGGALLFPYHRLDQVIFPPNPDIEKRYVEELSRQTDAVLEQHLKTAMFIFGFGMDLQTPDLTVEDRAVLSVEMRRRSLNCGDRSDRLKFALEMFREVDYMKGAERLEKRFIETARQKREQEERAAREKREQERLAQQQREEEERRAKEFGNSPSDFGWPSATRVVTLDFSRVTDDVLRNKILTIARKCRAVQETRIVPGREHVVGMRVSSDPEDIRCWLRQSSLPVMLSWVAPGQQRLLFTPVLVWQHQPLKAARRPLRRPCR
jgi:hypothetical protein